MGPTEVNPKIENDLLFGNFDDSGERVMNESDYKDHRDALLFAIDVSRSMTQLSDKLGGVSACELALKSIFDCISSRIIENSYNLTGIILYGVKTCNQCRVLMPLSIPDSSAIKNLRHFLQDAELYHEAFQYNKTKSPALIADLLFLANQQFNSFASKIPSRRLVLITDNDSPCTEDEPKGLLYAKTRAKDLYHLGVKVEPLFLLHEFNNESFDSSRFYDDLIYDTMLETELADFDGLDQLEIKAKSKTQPLQACNLSSEILSRRTIRRPLATNTIVLNAQINIGVQIYSLYRPQVASRATWIYAQGEVAKTVDHDTRIVVKTTGKDVLPEDVRRTYRFGEDFVKFTPKQLSKFRYFGEPTIRILGFKPASWLKFDDNVRPNYFIFPTDKQFLGSTRGFSALYQSLMRKDKIAIAYVITQKNSTPFYAALVPSPETDLSNPANPDTPAGLFLIPIPFADDRRRVPCIPADQQTVAPDSLVGIMRNIISKLKMSKGYEPYRYNNPALQLHYRALQAVALDDEYSDLYIEDKTMPKYNSIENRVGTLIGDFDHAVKDHLHISSDSTEAKNGLENEQSSGQKRLADDGTPITKEVKKRKNTRPEFSMKEVWRLYQSHIIHTYTNDQLQKFISRLNLKKSSLKGTVKELLVDTLVTYLDTLSSLDDLETAFGESGGEVNISEAAS
ncbi:Ku DNA-binding complex, Ku70 subunit [Nadsonia fulvescens var. elongata DSM 6958]|uniref:ATP-dependent DNA helicase II subunit 1 n=1 Tax=Nadsonia fulvescens var. elongata DSM 6958 TaxID=857566 RepID=A0A1E3PT04_9ASCO|nr:Ku DNA-binding complex, Ku70 subunit [Nadsonia fulvescens var. elongata DSM 6958]